jgi:HYR domain-containing protein
MRDRVLKRAALTAATLALVFAAAAQAAGSAPSVSVPANFRVEANTFGGWTAAFAATATDSAGASLAVSCTPAAGSVFPVGATTVTCSATDSAGVTGSASFTATVVDTLAPEISRMPDDVSWESPDPLGAPVYFWDPFGDDVVDGAVPVTCDPPSMSMFAVGVTTVTCSAADGAGNVATDSFSVEILFYDITPPVITGVSGDVSVETSDPAGAAVDFETGAAEDDVDGSLPVICDPASGSLFPVGTTTVTCTATDSAGNYMWTEFLVEVVLLDTTPPVLTDVPGEIARDTNDPAGAVVTWTDPTAVDAVSGTVGVTCTPASGSLFAAGPTVVTCSASDAAGNVATGSFTVNVTFKDTTPPALYGVPVDIWMDTSDRSGAIVGWRPEPFAVDDVDGTIGVSCSPASGSHFAIGTTGVTCSATDAAGNVATADPFSVHLTLVDSTAPVLSHVPSGIAVDTTNPAGRTVTWGLPSADDAVDGPVLVTCAPASGSTFAVGPTTVSCTASDAAGNVATDSFTVRVTLIVIVRDTTPPVLSRMPADIAVNTPDPTGRTVSWTAPTATDAVDGSVPVTCAPASGSRFRIGSTSVTCAASDRAGNAAQDSFTVRVTLTDTTPPTLTGVPGDITVQASATARMGVSWTMPTAVDNVDGPVPVTCNPASGSDFAVGSTTVRCTASDSSGNVATGSFTVLVTVATPEPGPVVGLEVEWGKPIRDSAMYKMKFGKKLELKATIAVDGVTLRKKTTPTPSLIIERLTGCGGAVVERRDGGAFKGKGHDWKLDVKTSKLGVGCWRLSVALDGAEGGAFELMIVDKNTRKADLKANERNLDEDPDED